MKKQNLIDGFYVYGNKGAMWTDKAHIAWRGSTTLCGTPMLATNHAGNAGCEPKCPACIDAYNYKVAPKVRRETKTMFKVDGWFYITEHKHVTVTASGKSVRVNGKTELMHGMLQNWFDNYEEANAYARKRATDKLRQAERRVAEARASLTALSSINVEKFRK